MLKVYQGCNGYYVADEDEAGWHYAPPSYECPTMTKRQAQAYLREIQRERDRADPLDALRLPTER